ILWSGGRSEIARRGWPGVDAPGLVSEGEAFTIEMSRIMKLGDGEEVAYGYRLIAEAELAPSTVNDMHIACQASKYVCASILSDCGGDVQEALRLLPEAEVRGKWEELESLSEKRQQSLGLRSGGCFVATQATALEDSWLLGARLDLGAAALSFAARETLRPMPNECFSDQDYQEALGHERPNVLPVSTSLYRNTLSFRCGQEYTAEIWVPRPSPLRSRARASPLGLVCVPCVARVEASPDFRLALDRKGLKIEAGGHGGHLPPRGGREGQPELARGDVDRSGHDRLAEPLAEAPAPSRSLRGVAEHTREGSLASEPARTLAPHRGRELVCRGKVVWNLLGDVSSAAGHGDQREERLLPGVRAAFIWCPSGLSAS
ncbi:unnamed protein product, partial [Symbiodinium sp. KB8]